MRFDDFIAINVSNSDRKKKIKKRKVIESKKYILHLEKISMLQTIIALLEGPASTAKKVNSPTEMQPMSV